MTFDETCDAVSESWDDHDLLDLVYGRRFGYLAGDPNFAPTGPIGLTLGACLIGAFAILGVKDIGPSPEKIGPVQQ